MFLSSYSQLSLHLTHCDNAENGSYLRFFEITLYLPLVGHDEMIRISIAFRSDWWECLSSWKSLAMCCSHGNVEVKLHMTGDLGLCMHLIEVKNTVYYYKHVEVLVTQLSAGTGFSKGGTMICKCTAVFLESGKLCRYLMHICIFKQQPVLWRVIVIWAAYSSLGFVMNEVMRKCQLFAWNIWTTQQSYYHVNI